MFFTAFIIIVAIIGVWATLVFVRKTMWDVVHRNLLDLEDMYGGKVSRQGFASRPIYQGTYENTGLTINFSTEKTADGRRTYIDISYAKSCPVSLTLSGKKWLEERNDDQPEDFVEVKNHNQNSFILRPKSEQRISRLINDEKFVDCLDELDQLAYLFVGNTGVICEFYSDEITKDTSAELLNRRLTTIRNILEMIS